MYPAPLSEEFRSFVYNGILEDGRVYPQEAEQRTSDAGEEVGVFGSRLPPSDQAVSISQGEIGGKIELKIKYLSQNNRQCSH